MISGINKEKAVLEHIKMLQDIIKRMAANSTSCKQWCIMLTTAIIGLSIKNSKIDDQLLLIALLPIAMLYFLDCFYLGLERSFRKMHKEFIWKLREGNLKEEDFFLVGNRPQKKTCIICSMLDKFYSQFKNTLMGVFSFSTTPFYALMTLMVYFITKVIFN